MKKNKLEERLNKRNSRGITLIGLVITLINSYD